MSGDESDLPESEIELIDIEVFGHLFVNYPLGLASENVKSIWPHRAHLIWPHPLGRGNRNLERWLIVSPMESQSPMFCN
jgi:hypothetical protein